MNRKTRPLLTRQFPNKHIFNYLCTFIVLLSLGALAILVQVPSGLGVTVLPSEKTFNAQLHNSLGRIDQAKAEWAAAESKSDASIPSLQNLEVYLGNWTNGIHRLEGCGVRYRLTSLEESQTDVATLTRDLYFRAGISRFYPAGTSYGIRSFWYRPRNYEVPLVVVTREFIIAKRLEPILILGVVVPTTLLFVVRWWKRTR